MYNHQKQNDMKRAIFAVALFLSIFTLWSCEEDRWGYDNKVIFSAEGGSKEVEGDSTICHLSIGDYNGNEISATEVAGVMTVTYDWLTATAQKNGNEIVLTAEPNKTGKQRKLYVYGSIHNRFTDITVIQKK